MKQLLACVMLTMAGAGAYSQLPEYASAPIPEALLKNSNRVTRYEKISYEVKSIGRAEHNTHQVTTILNKEGQHALIFRFHTNKFYHFDDAEIRLYDKNGKSIGKYSKKDFVSAAIPEGLVDDGKTHLFIAPAESYPLTVESKFSFSDENTLAYPSYSFQNPGEAVMQSQFTITVPSNLDLRYKECNVKLKPNVTEAGSKKTYNWEVKNLPPYDYEEGSIPDNYPHIQIAPNRFKLENFEGEMTSWKKFGVWYKDLAQGTEKLPEDRKAFYHDLVKNASSDIEKMKIVYDYLQKNFRYVSIQLGIGGHKPIPAAFTDSKKYGDCKGLSNYMYSVLKELGIKSHLALIYSEDKALPFDLDFPASQFNHMILCVPTKSDTLWFECTSKTLPFATLSVATQNRYALLIGDDGGSVATTPKSRSEHNLLLVKSEINLTENGSGSTASDIVATGEYRSMLSHFLYDEKKDEQKKFLVRGMGFKQPDDFTIIKKENGSDFASSLNLTIEKIPEFTAGSKMFLAPCAYTFWKDVLPKSDNRKNDYFFDCPFRKTDTTIYRLPAGYVMETVPSSKEIKFDYGSYVSKYWYDEKLRSVYSTTTLILNEQKIPVEKYAGVKTFFDTVLKESSQRIVVKKS